MLKNIAVRGRKDIIAVFQRIADISGKQDTGRRQATLDIINYVASLPCNEETIAILQSASKKHIDESGIDDATVPASIKISIDIDEETWDYAMKVFKYVFSSLKGNPQMPYFLKVGGNAYIRRIEEQNAELGIMEDKSITEEGSKVFSIEEFRKLSVGDKLDEIYRLLVERRCE